MDRHTHLESDLGIAAYLLSKGFQLQGLELLGSRYAFKFADDGQNASEVIQEYNHGGLVAAVTFAEAIKQLKNSLYTEKFRNGNGHGKYRSR